MTDEERIEHITTLAYLGGEGNPQADVRFLLMMLGKVEDPKESYERGYANGHDDGYSDGYGDGISDGYFHEA
jgi:hypothetical protein